MIYKRTPGDVPSLVSPTSLLTFSFLFIYFYEVQIIEEADHYLSVQSIYAEVFSIQAI
jgi:hypothetical protein